MMWGGVWKSKLSGSPTFKRQNFVSLLDDFVGHAGQVANGVADVLETLGGGDFVGLGEGHQESSCSLKIVQEGAAGKWN